MPSPELLAYNRETIEIQKELERLKKMREDAGALFRALALILICSL